MLLDSEESVEDMLLDCYQLLERTFKMESWVEFIHAKVPDNTRAQI